MWSRGICSAFVLLAASRAAEAAPCPATAVLDGDATLVDDVDAQLAQRGIATTATANCPAAKVRVEREGDAITVSVVDASGRRSQRTLADRDAAAALIESWARQDMNAAALLGWIEPPAAPAPAPEPHLDVVATAAPAGTDPRRMRDPFTLSASAEAARAFDATTYVGGRFSACGRLGPACIGATSRILAGNDRRSYDALATIDVPFGFGPRFMVVIGAGAGVGWFRAPSMMGEATTLATTVGVRIDGHAAVSFALTSHLSLYAGISIGASPQAPVRSDITGDSNRTNGEPSGFLRGDLGLRVGAP